MALRHRLADASYWFYDRWRHRAAFEAAGQPGTATDFSGLEGRKYAVLVTFKTEAERERAEAALDRHYGRTRRIYEGVMTKPSDMVYVEVTPGSTT